MKTALRLAGINSCQRLANRIPALGAGPSPCRPRHPWIRERQRPEVPAWGKTCENDGRPPPADESPYSRFISMGVRNWPWS
jgi:hypothetical protein